MKLLVDTDVVLDVALGREPWALEAARLLSAIEEGAARSPSRWPTTRTRFRPPVRLRVGADTIVTRNARDFAGVEGPCEPAGAVLAQL